MILFNKEYLLDNGLKIYSSRILGKLVIVYSKEFILLTRMLRNFIEKKVGSTLCGKKIESLCKFNILD